MKLTSLGYRSDLIIHRFEGEVTEREHYLVVRTLSNPSYRWGNFLIFDTPPRPGDLAAWTALFAREVGTPPRISHKLFAWDTVDGATGNLDDFLATGFRFSEEVVMTASTLRPPRRSPHDLEIRRLTTDADFAAHLELHVLCWDGPDDEASYRTFLATKVSSVRRLIAAGLGHWFGAFLDGQLVADMGLLTDGELGRYQAVVAHPDYRRRGICSTLLYRVGRFGLAELGLKTLVIVADEHYFAKDIYAAVGFRVRERQASLEWTPQGN